MKRPIKFSHVIVYASLPLVFAALSASAGGSGCDASNTLVGGECLAGYTQCGNDCFDLQNDREHCGNCEVNCGFRGFCSEGFCGGRPPPDSSMVDRMVPPDDGGSGLDGDADAMTFVDARNDRDMVCTPPFNTKDQCGDCFTQCKADEDCLLRNGSFSCGPLCSPPLVACGGRCIDVDIDPENCGVCGKFCVSFLCGGGVCQGTNPGQVVAIGHDYSTINQATSQARVLVNAVFIPRSNPLRILSYERDANPLAVQNVKSIITNNASGRQLVFTVSNSETDLAAANLSTRFDTIVIYDQENRSPANLAADATSWRTSLGTFLSRGGVIVVLDGAAGMGGMPRLLTDANLLNTPSHSPLLALARVTVVAPLDVMASQVVSPYAAFAKSVALNTLEPSVGNVTWVVRSANGVGNPVVIHKVVP
jgi:hypothetical protein